MMSRRLELAFFLLPHMINNFIICEFLPNLFLLLLTIDLGFPPAKPIDSHGFL